MAEFLIIRLSDGLTYHAELSAFKKSDHSIKDSSASGKIHADAGKPAQRLNTFKQ